MLIPVIRESTYIWDKKADLWSLDLDTTTGQWKCRREKDIALFVGKEQLLCAGAVVWTFLAYFRLALLPSPIVFKKCMKCEVRSENLTLALCILKSYSCLCYFDDTCRPASDFRIESSVQTIYQMMFQDQRTSITLCSHWTHNWHKLVLVKLIQLCAKLLKYMQFWPFLQYSKFTFFGILMKGLIRQ